MPSKVPLMPVTPKLPVSLGLVGSMEIIVLLLVSPNSRVVAASAGLTLPSSSNIVATANAAMTGLILLSFIAILSFLDRRY
jgi:hypothetical protein